MRKITFYLFVFFGLASCTTRYYLVRHAEKQCEDCPTCSLTVPGTERATALRDTLANKGIDTIFISECVRTRLTAQLLADRINKTLSVYQTNQLNSFINVLKNFNDNRDILVVGHSNQIPIIVDSLAHRQITIASEDFDNLFVITKKRFLGTSIRLQTLTYGAPSP